MSSKTLITRMVLKHMSHGNHAAGLRTWFIGTTVPLWQTSAIYPLFAIYYSTELVDIPFARAFRSGSATG